eukprot:scaffold1194_cov369-Prasinococcus_capsulatus_cf.AAC.23
MAARNGQRTVSGAAPRAGGAIACCLVALLAVAAHEPHTQRLGSVVGEPLNEEQVHSQQRRRQHSHAVELDKPLQQQGFVEIGGAHVRGNACKGAQAYMCINRKALLTDGKEKSGNAIQAFAHSWYLHKHQNLTESADAPCGSGLPQGNLSLSTLPAKEWLFTPAGQASHGDSSSISGIVIGNSHSDHNDVQVTFSSRQRRQYDLCAVVSSSWRLMGHEHGADIDSHDAVFRMNDAPAAAHPMLRHLDLSRHVGNRCVSQQLAGAATKRCHVRRPDQRMLIVVLRCLVCRTTVRVVNHSVGARTLRELFEVEPELEAVLERHFLVNGILREGRVSTDRVEQVAVIIPLRRSFRRAYA